MTGGPSMPLHGRVSPAFGAGGAISCSTFIARTRHGRDMSDEGALTNESDDGPTDSESDEGATTHETLAPGEPVYDESGRLIGHLTRFTDEGFEAKTTIEGDVDEEEVIPGKEFGEGYLMWRCGECGTMDELEDGIPETCPDCGAPSEAINPVQED